jgi:hypothetical protein
VPARERPYIVSPSVVAINPVSDVADLCVVPSANDVIPELVAALR